MGRADALRVLSEKSSQRPGEGVLSPGTTRRTCSVGRGDECKALSWAGRTEDGQRVTGAVKRRHRVGGSQARRLQQAPKILLSGTRSPCWV